MTSLAIVASHPIQYTAPWFRALGSESSLRTKVFYCWDFGAVERRDPHFNRTIKWDVPLLDGYDFEFVRNVSRSQGTDHFWGLQNPELVERVRSFQPDAVLVFGYKYAAIINFLMRWNRRRAPLLFRGDSHRLVRRTGWGELARRSIISSIFRRFSAFLYVGEANYRYFRYHHVPPDRLFFTPHAIDGARFNPDDPVVASDASAWRGELGIPRDALVVLFAGKLEVKKRPVELLEAFEALNHPDAVLLFAGSGSLEDELRSRASHVTNVRFASFQNQSSMPRTYAAADLFALPSYGPSETWGLAVNEAMSMGKAVIVSSHVGCGEDLVQPGRNGLTFKAGNRSALTEALAEALSDRDRLRWWGAAGRIMLERFSYARATEGLLEGLHFVTGTAP